MTTTSIACRSKRNMIDICRYASHHTGMTSICKICGASSETAEFYKGVRGRCKECHKSEVRKNRAERAQQYKEYEKMRFKRDPHRAEMNKAWAKTPEGKASHAESVRKRNRLNPEKRAANIIVGNAVRDGRIIKPTACSRCNGTPHRRDLHAHHHDYCLPLAVEWICVKCHGVEHHGIAPPPPASNRVRGRYVSRIKQHD